MADRPISPPYGKPVQELRTPCFRDGFFTVLVESDSDFYQQNWPVQRGTPYAKLLGADSRVITEFSSNPLYFLKALRPGNAGNDVAKSDLLTVWIFANDELVERSRRYRAKNHEKILEKRRAEYVAIDPEKRKELIKQRYWKYREKLLVAGKDWRDKNKEVMRQRNKERYKRIDGAKKMRELRATNLRVNLTGKLRCRIYMALKQAKLGLRKSTTTIKLLGCSYDEFRAYIESKFTGSMTWAKVLSGEIHIDHIKPCVSFDLTDPDQQAACFHFSNTQPLWAYDNLSKGDKIAASPILTS